MLVREIEARPPFGTFHQNYDNCPKLDVLFRACASGSGLDSRASPCPPSADSWRFFRRKVFFSATLHNFEAVQRLATRQRERSRGVGKRLSRSE